MKFFVPRNLFIVLGGRFVTGTRPLARVYAGHRIIDSGPKLQDRHLGVGCMARLGYGKRNSNFVYGVSNNFPLRPGTLCDLRYSGFSRGKTGRTSILQLSQPSGPGFWGSEDGKTKLDVVFVGRWSRYALSWGQFRTEQVPHWRLGGGDYFGLSSLIPPGCCRCGWRGGCGPSSHRGRGWDLDLLLGPGFGFGFDSDSHSHFDCSSNCGYDCSCCFGYNFH